MKRDKSQQDNLCINGIPEYEEESWDDTKELLQDTLREKLGVKKIQIERAHRVEAKEIGKDRTIVANICSYKDKQREARCQNREKIYVYEDFFKATVTIRKKKLGQKSTKAAE